MASKFKDKSGRVVSIGDFIVYAQAWGRSAGMNYAKVLDIKMSKAYGATRAYPTLRVIGIDTSWGGKNLQKPSTIVYSDRILVVSPKQVSPRALKTLSKYKEEVHGH